MIVGWLSKFANYLGQVPHTGLFAEVRGALDEKKFGSDLIVDTHHLEMFWLNLDSKNMNSIFKTLLTFQFVRDWLNDVLLNIQLISTTLPTSQFPIG